MYLWFTPQGWVQREGLCKVPCHKKISFAKNSWFRRFLCEKRFLPLCKAFRCIELRFIVILVATRAIV